MTLRLSYRTETTVPVEIEGLIPHATRGKPLDEIERFEAFVGNQKVPLAELFAVSGDSADERIVFEGDLSGVHWIGAHMQCGEIRVAGNAGRHVGSEMSGGHIHVEGNAGDWVGGEMHGGAIHIRGDAGHLVGAAYRGSARGMTNGSILIAGKVGNESGHTMRRGLIAIGSDVGDFAGLNMIAGTILVLGQCGIRPAAGMRRGTLALMGDEAPELLPTFRRGRSLRPIFLRLLLLGLRNHNFAVPDEILEADCTFYHGDQLTIGRGEVLVRTA